MATSAAIMRVPCGPSLPDVRNWGSTPEERALGFPCDRHLPRVDDVLYRGIGVEAPAGLVFRWLCQLRVAPYSYDWIDNGGRQSPRRLVPGLDRLEIGQRLMSMFELVDFEPDRYLTALSVPSLFGRFAVTYLLVPVSADGCRLVVKLVAAYPPALRPLLRRLVAAADWVMMRKQLLNLKDLAEEAHRIEIDPLGLIVGKPMHDPSSRLLLPHAP
jgi:hypothetical protein